MTDLWLDLRQAVRLCRRAPVMAAVIVGSLTLGIGATTAVFSFVNAIQFRSLPVADEQTLVDVSEWSATELCAGCGVGTSYPGFLEWQERARSFSAMSAYKEMSFAVSGGGEPERVGGAVVSAGLFPMLGVASFGGARDHGRRRDAVCVAGGADQRAPVAQPVRFPNRRHRPDAEGGRPGTHHRRHHAGRVSLAGVRAVVDPARGDGVGLAAHRSLADRCRAARPGHGSPAR